MTVRYALKVQKNCLAKCSYDSVVLIHDDKHDVSVLQATTEVSEPRRMDISGSGLHIMPEIILQSSHLVEELFIDHNKLQESALKSLTDFKKLRVVRIAANHFKKFPDQLMDILNLQVLDISKNEIERLPDNVFKMEK